MAQISGPRDAQPDGARLAERNGGPDPQRQRSYEWQDPAISAAVAPTMAGIDFFRALLDGALPIPPIAATLGFTMVLADPGRVVFEFTPAEFHYNPIGSVHGGVYATMCDSACGCAVHSMLPKGAYYTSQDLTVKVPAPDHRVDRAAAVRGHRHPPRLPHCARSGPAHRCPGKAVCARDEQLPYLPAVIAGLRSRTGRRSRRRTWRAPPGA